MEASRKGESLHQRMDQIKRSKFGIYDLSIPEKTDTLLELGAALVLGKEVVVIDRKDFSIPGTVRSLDRIEYESFSDLTEKLKKQMKTF